jgi:hypothetical protein
MSEQLPGEPNESAEDGPAGAVPKVPAPLLLYTMARLGLFLVVALILKVAGVQSLLLIVVLAALASGIMSFFLLNRLRERASTTVYKGVSKVRTTLDARRDEEDEAAEQLRLEEEARRRAVDPDANPSN